jgi:hypothetical protein
MGFLMGFKSHRHIVMSYRDFQLALVEKELRWTSVHYLQIID